MANSTKIRHGSRKKHDSKLRRKYGIGLRQYEQLFDDQQGKCFICREPDPTGRNLAVDHNHVTGQVRRLLCHHCNTGLGHFKDDISLLSRAIEYLNLSFSLPVDEEEVVVRRKKRGIVQTPTGYYPSLKEAAFHYNVDTTTMAVWCGRQYTCGGSKKEGFDIFNLVGYKSDHENICNQLRSGEILWSSLTEQGAICLDATR